MRKLIHRVKTNKNMIPFRYYYGQLEEKAKKLYREVYEGISHEKTEIKCHYYPGWEKDFVRIHKALCFDNPHLYTWNSQLIRSRCNEKTLFLYITYMDQQWSKRNMGSIMNRILQDSGALHAANDKEALQKLHDHLTKTWQYGYYPPEYMGVYHIVGPLVNQVGVCQGFAFAFKLFCDFLRIKCIVCDGWITDEENHTEEELDRYPNHAWNKVLINGQWRYVDLSQDIVNKENGYCRRWFLLTEKKMQKDHVVSL